jgi:hypothetical protein
MKTNLEWIALALAIGAVVLLLAMPARAGGRQNDPDVLEVSTPPPVEEGEAPPAQDDDGVIFSVSGTIGGEEPRPPSPSVQQIHDALLAISPGAGLQLPPAAAVDTADWQLVEAGLATMRVPRDWTVQTDIGEPGDEDQTIGLSPPSNDLYVELRMIRNADSNYLQHASGHAVSEYSRSLDRLKEGVILGFQPLLVGGAAGGVEVMNQFGKEFDDDGTRTFRLILWRGRWEQETGIHRVQFDATFAQDRFDAVAPLVRAILDTVETREADSAATP